MDIRVRLLHFEVDKKPALHLRQQPSTTASSSSSVSHSTGSDTAQSGISADPPESSSSSQFGPLFPAPTSSSSTPDGSNPSSNAASLYLFVFLATLLLLLGLSVGILLRSFVLRRRFRRRVEEALAAGVYYGPRMDPGGPPLLGRWKRPVLHDVVLDHPEKERLLTVHMTECWYNVQPLCAIVLPSDPCCRGHNASQAQYSQQQPQRATPPVGLLRHLWVNSLGFRDDVPTGTGGSTSTEALTQGSDSHSMPPRSTTRTSGTSFAALWQPQLDHGGTSTLHLSLPATSMQSSARRRQERERQVNPDIVLSTVDKSEAAVTKGNVDTGDGASQGGLVRVAVVVAMPSQGYSKDAVGLQGLAIELGVLEENVDGMAGRDHGETDTTAG